MGCKALKKRVRISLGYVVRRFNTLQRIQVRHFSYRNNQLIILYICHSEPNRQLVDDSELGSEKNTVRKAESGGNQHFPIPPETSSTQSKIISPVLRILA